MKNSKYVFEISAILSLALSANAFAFRPVDSKPTIFKRSGVETPDLGEKLYRANTKAIKSDLADYVEVDNVNGKVRLMEGNIKGAALVTSKDKSAFIEAIKSYVNKNQAIFGLGFDSLALNESSSVFGENNQFFKFDVIIGGKTVKEAQVDFRFQNGNLYQVVNQSFAEASVKPEILDQSAALDYATYASEGEVTLESKSSYRVELTNGKYELIPVTKFSSKSVAGEFNFEVDMSNASIREVTHKHFHANAVIQGFSRTHKEDPLNVYYENGIIYSANGNRLRAGKEGSLNSGDYLFDEIDGAAATVKSKDMKVALKRAKAISTKNGAASEYILNPWKNASADDTWASYGTVYANISVIKNLITKTTGRTLTPWMAKPTLAYVNYNSNCNAFWNGTSINFFQGSSKCSNSGNLGEIVLHEWGHGLDYNLGGISDGAYSEGFGDLLAFSVYWSPKIGEGFFKGSSKAVRDISVFKSYPKDKGQVHAEGQIIGNTMFDLYANLYNNFGEEVAKSKFRSYVYNMIASTKMYTDVHNFIQSFEREAKFKCAVNKVFTKHGLANLRNECR
jgi:hypothetical protein